MKLFVRKYLTFFVQRLRYYRYRMKGYDIRKSTRMERRLNLDRLNPKGIHVGENSAIASGVTILSHRYKFAKRNGGRFVWENMDTYIGDNSVVGIGSIIQAGVRIGDEVVIGSGSVVTKDVPSYTIAAGNPARIIKEEISIEDIYL